MSGIKITPKARDMIRREMKGLKVSDVVLMLRKAAKISHPLGNRRYNDYIFRIVKGELVSVRKMHVAKQVEKTGNKDCTVCLGDGVFTVWELCSSCSGVGCSVCSNKGEILKRRRCQCVQKKVLLAK